MDTKVNLADLIHRGGVMEIDAANTAACCHVGKSK